MLDGMQDLLSRLAVPLLSFEYAVGWHKHFGLPRALTPAERAEAHERSLHAFQRRLGELGYDTYLINAGDGDGSTGVVLVPVSGGFWHDDLEVCANRSRFYGSNGQWCWNDLLVVRRCDPCLRHLLFNSLLPLTREAPPGIPGSLGVTVRRGVKFKRPFADTCPCI